MYEVELSLYMFIICSNNLSEIKNDTISVSISQHK